MKKLLSLLTVLALCCAGLHAQSTNDFTVSVPTNTVLVPAVPALTATTGAIVIDRLIVDNVNSRALIYIHGISQPVVITGDGFIALKAAVGPTFSAAVTALLAPTN